MRTSLSCLANYRYGDQSKACGGQVNTRTPIKKPVPMRDMTVPIAYRTNDIVEECQDVWTAWFLGLNALAKLPSCPMKSNTDPRILRTKPSARLQMVRHISKEKVGHGK